MSETPHGDGPFDPLIVAAQALLATSNRSWISISGQLRTWRDEDLLDEGRRLYGNEKAGKPTTSRGLMNRQNRQYETVHRFWATDQPWRIRMDRVHNTIPNAGYHFDVLIVHGATWWVQNTKPHGMNISSNTGQENYTASVHQGSLNLDYMLRPTALVKALHASEAIVTQVGGRRAIQLRGTPITPDSEAFWLMGGLLALGATYYVVTVDAVYGILLRVETYIDNQVARREELTDVSIDTPIEAELFISQG